MSRDSQHDEPWFSNPGSPDGGFERHEPDPDEAYEKQRQYEIDHPLKDTLRVLVSWTCNLKCSYCCNDTLPAIRAGIRPVKFSQLDVMPYRVVCITGGEPLLFLGRVKNVCDLARSKGKFIVVYTNATHMTREIALSLAEWGVHAINVGLHYPATFDHIISNTLDATRDLPMNVRFHAEDISMFLLPDLYPGVNFRFWKRDDCERDNEDRVVLEEES